MDVRETISKESRNYFGGIQNSLVKLMLVFPGAVGDGHKIKFLHPVVAAGMAEMLHVLKLVGNADLSSVRQKLLIL